MCFTKRDKVSFPKQTFQNGRPGARDRVGETRGGLRADDRRIRLTALVQHRVHVAPACALATEFDFMRRRLNRRTAMRWILVGGLTVCLLSLLAGPVSAKKYVHKHHRHQHLSIERYPHATAGQRENSIAFDDGGYYERDYRAHAFGSRSWWFLQQGRGRR